MSAHFGNRTTDLDISTVPADVLARALAHVQEHYPQGSDWTVLHYASIDPSHGDYSSYGDEYPWYLDLSYKCSYHGGQVWAVLLGINKDGEPTVFMD